MTLTKKHIRPFAKLHGYWIYKRFLVETESWSLEQKRDYVFDRLKETLVRAGEGVPFYRERFRTIGFEPQSDFRDLGDLGRLPVLTKQDIRENFDQMIDRRFYRGSVLASTSGSTGEPTQMRLNEWYIALDYACMFRHWAKAGYSFRSRSGALRTYTPKSDEGPFWRFSRSQNTLYLSPYHLRPSNIDEYVSIIVRYKPQFLRGYPSALTVLAEHVYDRRDELSFVCGVFPTSETLMDKERTNIERTFGDVVYDWYGMTEPAVVITENRSHDGMSVEWVYGYPELLPSDMGGCQHELLATSLHNPVMPFIRYETGDVLEVRGGAPEADELYPRITSICGRKDDCILTPDGGRLPSLNFYSLFQEYSEVLRFQFVQESVERVVVKVQF